MLTPLLVLPTLHDRIAGAVFEGLSARRVLLALECAAFLFVVRIVVFFMHSFLRHGMLLFVRMDIPSRSLYGVFRSNLQDVYHSLLIVLNLAIIDFIFRTYGVQELWSTFFTVSNIIYDTVGNPELWWHT